MKPLHPPSENIPEEQKTILHKRLETLDQDQKASVEARKAIRAGRAKLKQLQPK